MKAMGSLEPLNRKIRDGLNSRIENLEKMFLKNFHSINTYTIYVIVTNKANIQIQIITHNGEDIIAN
jgi:hypothetical protein